MQRAPSRFLAGWFPIVWLASAMSFGCDGGTASTPDAGPAPSPDAGLTRYVVTDGCNPIAEAWDCLFPFPSDVFRIETPTGRG